MSARPGNESQKFIADLNLPTEIPAMCFRRLIVSAFFLAIGLIAVTPALAKPPKDKPGGGNGGGGDSGGSGYVMVPLADSSGSLNGIGYAEGLHELRDEAGELVGMEVVGVSAGDAHYWALDASGTPFVAEALLLPDGADSSTTVTAANDINDDGIIVGSAGTMGTLRPMAWPSFLESPIELPVPTAFVGDAIAVEINNHGLVVGWLSSDTERSIVAWGLQADSTPVGPTVLGADIDAWAPDVNDAGTVVGTIQDQAYRWQLTWDGTHLSASNAEALWIGDIPLQSATAINEHGDICGEYRPDGPQTYLLTAGGALIDMPYLVDTGRHATTNTQANDLNDAADINSVQVVGEVNIYRAKGTPIIDRLGAEVVWQGGQTIDLEKVTNQPNSDLNLQWIGAISNAGWLAGYALTPDLFDERAVVLVPNP